MQGVGYRFFVVQQARGLNLAGWTRNLEDGAVEVQAWGEPSALALMECALREGPPHSRVAAVTTVTPSGALLERRGFTIEHDGY